MSYSSNQRDALDAALPLKHRASHARSCAMLIGHKWRIHRDIVMDEVWRKCGINLLAIANDTEIPIAMTVLEELRFNGVPHDGSGSK